MLEYFIHIDPDHPPKNLVVVTAEIPSGVPRVSISATQLPANWRDTPAHAELAAIGDDFVHRGRAAILIVPSVLAPIESNWLINPLHPAFPRIRLHPVKPFDYDARLFRPSH
jgi:RES domain-containing protein